MKKSIKKLIAIGIVASSICILPLTGASAEWRRDSTGWWYSQGITYAKGWLQDKDGKWYYFDNNGYMEHDTSVNGYQLGSDGAWIQNTNINSNNVSNTSNIDSNNTTNFNNTTNVNNYINNGTINNNTNNITNNYIYINNSSTTASDETAVKEKAFDGTNGFQQVGDNQYIYYENGKILTHAWKKFDEGYRHFDENGYLDFSKTIDGLDINAKGLYPLNNKSNDLIKTIFMQLKPYQTFMGNYGSGDLEYITDTFDVFGIKYEIQYVDVYNSNEDGQILEVDSSYGGKNDHWTQMNNDNFTCKKIIEIGKYASRISLN